MESMQKDLVSIIVPVYNVEKYLKQCIDSIINQTYINTEIILIDDGSTDNSGKICDDYAKKDNRIKVIHKKNEGISATRNRGIDEAYGEYISFVDSDDYIDKDMISILCEDIENNNADIAVCDYYVQEDTKQIKKIKKDDIHNVKTLLPSEALKKCFQKEFEFYLWNKMFKKTLFNGIKFPNGKNSEERYTLPKLIDNSKKIIFDSEKLYYYRIRKDSIIHSNDKINCDALDADNYLVQYIEKNHKEIENEAKKSLINTNLAIYNKIYLNKKNDLKTIQLICNNIKKNYTKSIKKSENAKFNIKIVLFLKMRKVYNIMIAIKKT